MRALLYEYKKNKVCPYIIFAVLILLVGNVIIGFLYHDSTFGNRDRLEEERQFFVTALEEAGEDADVFIQETCEEKISIISYCIEHDIPYGQLSIYSNFVKNNMLLGLIICLIALVSYNFVAVEDENGTWKNLILASKGRLDKIYFRKKIAAVLAVILVNLIFILVAFLYGAIRYGNWNDVNISYAEGQIILSSYSNQIQNVIISGMVRGTVYSSLAFLIACSFRRSKIALISLIVLTLGESTINNFLNNFKISKFLPFHYLEILENFHDYPVKTQIIAMIYVAFMLAIFHVVSYTIIKRKFI